MAKRSTPSDRILVDPLFSIPEGAEDQFVFSREGTDTNEVLDEFGNALEGADVIDDGFSDTGVEYDFDDGEGDLDGETLEIPNDFKIISQKIRRAPGGQQVVDIIIECEDVEGAAKYEMRVTKV